MLHEARRQRGRVNRLDGGLDGAAAHDLGGAALGLDGAVDALALQEEQRLAADGLHVAVQQHKARLECVKRGAAADDVEGVRVDAAAMRHKDVEWPKDG